jgi:hypothetical protein
MKRTLPDGGSDRRVRFFNFSLRNGVVMSTPVYEESQALMANLIRSIETLNPEFAWVQLLFVRTDYSVALVRLKNAIRASKLEIEQPATDIITGEEHEKRDLHRDFYGKADARIKKIDETATKPTVTMAIQGMWVGGKANSPRDLPFDHCVDEHDALSAFLYRDPRLLLELVSRRMVDDISAYFYRYVGSRFEPPSFMATPEGMSHYVHLPAGERVNSLTSLSWGTFTRGLTVGTVGEAQDSGLHNDIVTPLVRLERVPKIEKPLDDSEIQPLVHLASAKVRSFEIVYDDGRTDVVLSAKSVADMRRYADLLDAVYGQLKYEGTDPLPPYLRNLPRLVGLVREERN